MRITILALLICSTLVRANIPSVPDSISPDGKIHAVMDVDRDSTISPEWKGDSFPQIEITEKLTGQVLTSISYFGAVGDDQRPLREHVRISWRPDSRAFGVTIRDRYYSSSTVFVLNESKQFVSVSITTDYEKMTGFTTPDVDHLQPKGRDSIVGWDNTGLLIYRIFRLPLATFVGKDPLDHRVFLAVSAEGAKVIKVEHDEGEWSHGDWISKNQNSKDSFE